MPKQFVSELKNGDLVRSAFMIKKSQWRDFSSKPGKYLSLELGDKTGSISARLWDAKDIILKEEEVVFIEGRVEAYNNTLQIIINSLRKEDNYSKEDYLPRGKGDTESLLAQVEHVIQAIKNPFLQKLLHSFFDDPSFVTCFKEAPAARSIHHAYLGGLLEHTFEVVSICQRVAQLYPQIDADLLLSGAILHDLGKLQELKYSLAMDYSDDGRLLGHIVMGDQMVCQKIAEIDSFPDQLGLKLRHMILSHHGEYEWGSPKRPKTIEACVLHYADLLDGRVNEFLQIIEKNQDKHWTDYYKPLERCLYVA